MHCSLLYGVFKWDGGTRRGAPAPRHRHNLFSSHNWLRSINQTWAGERREVPCSNQLSHWIWTETKPVSNDFQHGPSQCSAVRSLRAPTIHRHDQWGQFAKFRKKIVFQKFAAPHFRAELRSSWQQQRGRRGGGLGPAPGGRWSPQHSACQAAVTRSR